MFFFVIINNILIKIKNKKIKAITINAIAFCNETNYSSFFSSIEAIFIARTFNESPNKLINPSAS